MALFGHPATSAIRARWVVEPTWRGQAQQAAANLRRLALETFQAGTEAELENAFAALRRQRLPGVVVGNDTFFANREEPMAALSRRHSMPAVHQREFAAAGGLVGLGGVVAQSHGRAGAYVGRILKGERPSELPVQQVTKVELVINLKTAKTLELTLPPTLLARADEVIE
jgi:ABC-type uncharacterized transport system substrate-binding protein